MDSLDDDMMDGETGRVCKRNHITSEAVASAGVFDGPLWLKNAKHTINTGFFEVLLNLG